MVAIISRAAVIESPRAGWVDAAKGLGIIFVVVGHVLRGLVNSNLLTRTPAVAFTDAWIYAFHMPLFFFLSGLFLSRSATRPSLEFLRKKIGTIAYPYFVWSLITLSIKSSLGPIVNQPRTLLEAPEILYRPIEQFWFLYVLFLLSIMVGFLLKFGIKPWAIVVFAALLYLGVWPPWSGFLPFEFCKWNGIYLAFGVAVGGGQVLCFITDAKDRTLIAVAFFGLLIVTSFAVFLETTHQHVLDFVLAVSGTAGVVALAVFVNRLRIDSAISFLGRYSLEIFVAHTITSSAIRILLQQIWHVTAPGPYVVLCTIAGLYGPVLVAITLERVGFNWAFTIPRSKEQKDLKQSDDLKLQHRPGSR
jgi:fucose 4-O-acetylase-like acetyltransferase